MNAAAHRRPAPQIAPPALTWQRGYWKPAIKPDASPAERKSVEKDWHYNIDRMLYNLFSLLCLPPNSQFVSPNLEGELKGQRDERTLYIFNHKVRLEATDNGKLEELIPEEQAVRHEMFFFRTNFSGIKFIVQARLHLEYFTLLFAADFSHNPSKFTGPISTIWDDFQRLHELIIERCQADTNIYRTELSKDGQSLVARYKWTVEEGFKDWIEEICEKAFGPDLNRTPHEPSRCGKIFADLFGMVFGLKLVVPSTHKGESDIKNDEAVAAVPTNLLTTTYARFEKDKHLRLSALVGGTLFPPKASSALIDAIWPIIKWRNADRLELEERHGKAEYSATLFENREALYLSSLGRLLPNTGPEPIVYHLIASYSGKWRLGRLIDQIHSLETLRLAALRDLKEINGASEDINVLSARTSIARADESTLVNFAQIGQEIDFGLTYRIDRSRNYVASLRELLDTMKTEDVPGFQKYGDFMRRRIFDTFDYIDRVGSRYDELRRQITFLIDGGHEQTMMALQTATAENTSVTNDLLRIAEVFGVVPITYYVGKVTHATALDLSKYWPALAGHIPTGHLPYFGFGLALGLSVAIYSRHARTKKIARE
jgi:hypothetical protein